MIYFDKNKKAYAFEIENPICVIENELWKKYAGNDNWDIVEGEFVDISETEEYKQAQIEKEQEKIDNLTMTALDFINCLKKFGLTDNMIENYLNNNLQAKHQLTFCQNVYCKVAKSFMPLTFGEITITKEMVEEMFKEKSNIEN